MGGNNLATTKCGRGMLCCGNDNDDEHEEIVEIFKYDSTYSNK